MTNKDASHLRIVHSECSLGWGGQENRILTELLGFQARGAAVHLLAPAESEIYQRTEQAGIGVRAASFKKARYPLTLLQTAAWLRRIRCNVLNPHSSRDGWLVSAAGRLALTPFIVRTRHIDVSYSTPWASRHAFGTLVDHVFTTSLKITEHLRTVLGLAEDRISTIPTGIDVEKFSPAAVPAELFPSGWPAQGPTIGLVAVLRSMKGHLIFLEAIALLRERGFKGRYVMVGEGPMREAILKQITALRLEGQVLLTGHREDIPNVLRALDLLVMPSTKEGVPQIGLQALAAMTPVAGSDVGGIPEIIRPGDTGRIFAGSNPGALADVVQTTFAEPEKTLRMAARGRQLVEEKHSLEHMLDRIDAVYRRYLVK